MNEIDTRADSDETAVNLEFESATRAQSSGQAHRDRPTIAPGVVLNDRFTLERLLGGGGMGEVWLGRDRVLGRRVAAKVILPLDPTLRERTRVEGTLRESFVDEAKIGASLAHPAIATVFDFGFFEGEPFIIFEYIDGETLKDYMARRGRLPLQDAQLIIGPLAQALDFAHAHHIVHRDLKPENIRSTRQGHFKILDLGLAKEFRSQIDWRRFAGTPAYTSPEQAAGLACDGRTDQYCLALIAYEMVVGRRPFVSHDWKQLLRMQAESSPPSPRLYVPENVSVALLKALSKDPSQRYTTCADFAVAFGCQSLTEEAWTPKLLQLTSARVALLGARSSNRTSLFGVRVGVTHEYLCIVYREEIRILPLGCIFEAATRGLSGLEIRYVSNGNESSETLKFWSPGASRSWKNLLQPLIAANKDDAEALSALLAVRPRVVHTRRTPPVRHQVLGSVDYRASGRAQASAGIEIQAALLGADAVSDIQRERVIRLGHTLHRLSGIALRAVDEQGREEIVVRAQANEIAALTRRMFIVLGVLLALTEWGLFRGGADTYFLIGAAIVLFLWPLAFIALLRWLRWPELIKPVAVTLPVLTGALVGTALYSPRSGFAPGGDYLPFLILELIALAYPLRLAARAWKAFDSYRGMLSTVAIPRTRGRKVAGYAMWSVVFVWGLSVLGAMKQVPRGEVDPLQVEARMNLQIGASELRTGGAEHLKVAEQALRKSVDLGSALISRPNSDSQSYMLLAAAQVSLGEALAEQQAYPEAVKVLESALDTVNVCWVKLPGCQDFHPADQATRIQSLLTIYRPRTMPNAREAAAASKLFLEGMASYNKNPRDLPAAEASFGSALRVFQVISQAPDTRPEYSEQLMATSYNLGLVYFAQARLSEAERSFSDALEQEKILRQRFPKYNTRENIAPQAEVQLKTVRQVMLQNKVIVAREELSAAVKLASSTPPSVNAAEAKLQAALRDWRALTEADSSFRPVLAQVYFDLGWLYLTQQKYAQAEKPLRSSLRQLELLKTMTAEQQMLHDRIRGILSERVMKNPEDRH